MYATGRVLHVSPLWIVAAAVLVVGAVLIGRAAVLCDYEARGAQADLDDAAAALAALGVQRTGFDQAIGRLGRTAQAVGGPVKASQASVRIARSWWRRARTL